MVRRQIEYILGWWLVEEFCSNDLRDESAVLELRRTTIAQFERLCRAGRVCHLNLPCPTLFAFVAFVHDVPTILSSGCSPLSRESLVGLRGQHCLWLYTVFLTRFVMRLLQFTKAVLNYNHQTPVTEASGDILTEIRVPLYHLHLPKLISEGLITSDSERHLVDPTEQLARVQPSLSRILEADSSLETPVKLSRRPTAFLFAHPNRSVLTTPD